MAAASLRNRYVNDSITTASPAQLVAMLFDRLVLDLQRAAAAQRSRQREQAHLELTHAQDIITVLANNLEPSAGQIATNLGALYTFLHAELVQANVKNDPERTEWVLSEVEPLRDAWRQAVGGETPAAATVGAVGAGPNLPTQQGAPGTYGSHGSVAAASSSSMLGRLA